MKIMPRIGLYILLALAFILILAFVKNDEDDEEVEGVQKRRLQRLKSTCAAESEALASERRLIDGLVLDKGLGLAFCHVPKAASTFWLNVLAKSMNLEFDEDVHNGLLSRSVADSDGLFNLAFVRHPLSRLVSAYVNKFVNNRDEKFIKPMVRFLKRKSRNPLKAQTRIGFREFVEFALDEIERRRISHGSFHWMPMRNMCGFCQRPFHFIGKVETMQSDVEVLLRKFPGLKPAIKAVEERPNAALAKAKDEHVTEKYLKQLPEDLQVRLCQVYKIDFEMFGYQCDI